MRLVTTIALLVSLSLAACGGDTPAEPQGPVGVWSTSKPNPVVGRLRAAVIDRPAPGLARIAVEWEALPSMTHCALQIVLPDEVDRIEGDEVVDLPADTPSGRAEWVVAFPAERTLDATVRLCADTETGMRACEAAVRLVTVPTRP